MMLGSKSILPPLIPDCSALRALSILKTQNARSSPGASLAHMLLASFYSSAAGVMPPFSLFLFLFSSSAPPLYSSINKGVE